MLLAVITLASVSKVVTFLVTLSILVVLHEYGHFIIARRNGVKVNEFAVGMGPKIVGWTSQRSGTLYSIRALPIGGYCAMEGEDNKSTEAEQQREFREEAQSAAGAVASNNFQAKTPWQRLAIVLAGPIANFLLAYLILLVGALVFGVPSKSAAPIVAGVMDGSPASRAGVQTGDHIIAIDGEQITDGMRVIDIFHRSLGKQVTVVFDRSGTRRTVRLTPEPCPKETGAQFGCIGIYPAAQYQRVSPLGAIAESNSEFVGIAYNSYQSIKLLTTQFKQYAGQVTGPIGMGQAATVVQDLGWGPYLRLAAMISFALGFFNLLPVPALDGGRAAFIIAELLRGKPVDPEKEAMVHIAGFALLMALMLIVAFHDIARLVSGKGVL